MANPHKGEVAFKARGKNRVLRLNTDAICGLETQFDLAITEIHSRILGGRFSMVRAAYCVAIDGGAELSEANEIIDELGLPPAHKLLVEAFNLTFPMPDENDRSGGPPPKGEGAGIGKDS